MTQSTLISATRMPRLRILALAQGLVIVASLLAPLTTFAAITSVTVGAQVPNPVTAGNSAVYIVTVQHTAGLATRVSSISGLPTGATFTSGCSTASPATLTVTISTTVATPVGTSTFTPTVREQNNANCNPNSSGTTDSTATGSLTVSAAPKTDQTITFPALAGVRLDQAAPVPAATASSGLAVTYSTSTATICTVTSGGAITLLHVGLCTIAADQAGDATWNAAPQVLQSFTVSAASVPPSLTLNKSTVPQGGKVLVTGQGYMPDDTVDVYLNSTPVLLTTVATDGSGGFSVTVTIPSTTVVGAHTIEGLGLDPNGEPLSLTAPITVTAAAAQPATDTTPTATAGKDPDPLPIGILLLLFLVLSGVAVALADPRSTRKQR